MRIKDNGFFNYGRDGNVGYRETLAAADQFFSVKHGFLEEGCRESNEEMMTETRQPVFHTKTGRNPKLPIAGLLVAIASQILCRHSSP